MTQTDRLKALVDLGGPKGIEYIPPAPEFVPPSYTAPPPWPQPRRRGRLARIFSRSRAMWGRLVDVTGRSRRSERQP